MPLAYADLLKFAAIVVVPVAIVMAVMLWRLYRVQNPKEFDWKYNRREAQAERSRSRSGAGSQSRPGPAPERRQFHAD